MFQFQMWVYGTTEVFQLHFWVFRCTVSPHFTAFSTTTIDSSDHMYSLRFFGLLELRRTVGADLDLGLPTLRFFMAGMAYL